MRLVFESGRPIAHVAADLGVPPETLRKRVRQAEADEGSAPSLLKRRSARRSASCVKENCELRRANEILKSASVFFAQASSTQTDRSERAISMSIAIASGSSRSAGPWACRRPRTTSAPTGERSARAVEDERLLERDPRDAQAQLRGLRVSADVEGAAARRRARPALPGAAADGASTGSRARSGAASRGGRPSPTRRPRGARIWSSATSPPSAPNRLWVGGFHVSALLGGRRVLQLRDRRVQPDGRRLAARRATCAPTLVLDALRMALGLREPGADVALVATPTPGRNTRARLHADARRSRRARVDRDGRRRLRQRAGRDLRRFLQDRADRRPRLALPQRSSSSRSSTTSRWFNHDRLHESLGDIPPVEYEQRHAAAIALTTRRVSTVGVELEVQPPDLSRECSRAPNVIRSGRDHGSQGTNGRGWPLRPEVEETYSLTGTSTTATPTTEEPT